MKRIAIVGCAGTGKTYLAQKLHIMLKLPLYHLDQYYWSAQWQRVDPAIFKAQHDAFCDESHWIIEGVASKNMQYRLEKADVIIFLDVPWYTYLWRVFKRTVRNYGKQLPTSALQCKERFSWEFLVWMWNFEKTKKPHLVELLQERSDKKVYIFKSQKEVNAFLESMHQ